MPVTMPVDRHISDATDVAGGAALRRHDTFNKEHICGKTSARLCYKKKKDTDELFVVVLL